MQRDYLEQIAEWKGKRNRKPLVLMGARQVGFFLGGGQTDSAADAA